MYKIFCRNCTLLRHSTAKIHIRKSVHDAFDAIFHEVASEVKDKAESQPFEFQIREQLLRSELSYGFGLYFVVHGKTRRRQDFAHEKKAGSEDMGFAWVQEILEKLEVSWRALQVEAEEEEGATLRRCCFGGVQ